MMNGSNVLEGYVPDVDADHVTRILDPVGASSASPCVSIFASRAAAILPDTGQVLNRMIRSDLPEAASSGSARSSSRER